MSLFKSRKFWLAVVGVGQTIFFHFLPNVDPQVWEAINTILMVLIAGIALEDAGAKAGGFTKE